MRPYSQSFTLILGWLWLFLGAVALHAQEVDSPPAMEVSAELAQKYPLKSHHAKLSFGCLDCHTNQGSNLANLKRLKDDDCLSCHQSRDKMASRLAFMELKKASPHNSIHDGKRLHCDECHMEHHPSVNMCSECHEREVPLWMGETP